MSNHRLTLLIALLFVSAGIAPALAGGAAAQTTQETARDARLVVEQPHYVTSDVATASANGTRTYRATGAPLELHPQNFDAENVIDFGLTTDAGALSYNEPTGQFVFEASETGTYELYWLVAEEVVVTETVNGTQVNTTETRQVRYEARLDVSGPLELRHIEQGSLEETRQDAANWREFNATVQDLRKDNLWVQLGLAPPLSTEETVQEMVDAYLLKNNPTRALSGNIAQILFLLALSVGGLFLALLVTGYHTVVVGYLTRKLNRFESVEADEGAVAERVEADQRRRRKTAVANHSFADIWGDDFVAEAMSEAGRNPLQAFTNYWSRNDEAESMRWLVQVMGQNGYVGRVDEDAAVTDGSGENATIEAADAVHVVREAEIVDGDITVDLTDADADLVRSIPEWDADVFLEFDIGEAEWDPEQLAGDMDVAESLGEVVAESNIDERHFEDRNEIARLQLQLMQYIREETALTDDRSSVDSLRFLLEQHLDAANVLNDRFRLPLEVHTKRLEALINAHDETAEAKQTLNDIKEGKFS